MILAALVLLSLTIGIAGWAFDSSFLSKYSGRQMGIQQMSLENFLTIYLSGLASVSVALFLLALLGFFTGFVLIVLAAGCVILCL